MGFRCRSLALMTLILCAANSVARTQQVIFDSLGFESPPYSPGLLAPQNGWATTEVFDGGSNDAGVVQAFVARSGEQALQIIGPNVNDAAAFPREAFWTQAGLGFATAGAVVRIEWYMRVEAPGFLETPATMYSLEFEGLIGGAALNRINLVGMVPDESGTNDVVVQDPVNGFVALFNGADFGVWHHFVVELDFATEMMRLTANGIEANSLTPFVTTGHTVFQELNVHTIMPDQGLLSPNDAYYDDIVVTTVSDGCTDSQVAELADCLSPAGRIPTPTGSMTALECVQAYDTDGDLDVDLEDVAEFVVGCNP